MCQLISRQRVRRAALLLAAITICLSVTGRAESADANPALVLPESAFGYVHLQVDSLREVPSFELFTQLFNHVSTETSVWSATRFGIDFTALTDVTIVVPPFEQLMASQGTGEFPLCVVATFSKSFRIADFTRRLPEGWQLSSDQGDRYYVNGTNEAIHIPSNTSIVFGSPAGVTWWMGTEYDDSEGSLTEMLNGSLESGHLLFGVDLSQVPDEFYAAFPPAAQWLATTEMASIDIYLDDEITLAGYFYFEDDGGAVEAQSQFRDLIAQGNTALSTYEEQFRQKAGDTAATTDEAFTSIMSLALVREGADLLDNIEVSREEESVSVALTLDQRMLTAIAGSVAITQQLGSQASSTFQDVADEIGTGSE